MTPREQNRNVTMLEDLPDISELNGHASLPYSGAQHLPIAEVDRYKKFIRGGHIPPQESGMFPRALPPPRDVSPYLNEAIVDAKSKYGLSDSPSCLEVADHVANCPICSKFYNTDKTMYVIAIVILAIICVILLKKILNV